MGTIHWKRSTGDFVESHCGAWWITPIYGGLTRPERYELLMKTTDGWKIVGSGATQRECKEVAANLDERELGLLARPLPNRQG